MYAPLTSPHLLRYLNGFGHWILGFFVAVLLALTSMVAHAATPAAGASISNQASASYTDGSATPRTVTSNTVSTTVTQVASMTLTAPGAKPASPGGVVYYPHTLTNTGNGTDTYALTASNTGAFTMTSVEYFLDNGAGQPTGPAITSTGPLASGASFKFIAVGTLPNTATSAQTNTITVTGTSTFNATITESNADVTTVTANAVVDLTKAISASSGLPGSGPYTYTLTFTNNGNSTASAVEITDLIPADMTFVAGSARWSATGTTDIVSTGGATSIGAAPNTVNASIGGQNFVATLNQLTAGQSGSITFQVNVNAGVAPGVLNNTATTSYSNGLANATGKSNTVPFTVLQTAAVTFTGPAAVASANPGSTVSFDNMVTNGGTGVDTFNITLGTNDFPAGTTFQLFKQGGLTPLVDTNSDSILDTGPLAAGATYTVVLKATLPPNATNATAPFAIEKIATSVFDPTKSATATDTLLAIKDASVDLTNDAAIGGANALGTNPDTAGAKVNINTNPGTTATFTLFANNTGPSPDSYNLAVTGSATNGVPTFGTLQNLPAGWTVTFKAATGAAGNECSSTGANIINTGNVAAGSFVAVCAVVTVPAGFEAGTKDLYFRVLSPTSGVTDIIRDAVSVNAVRSITITPNGAGQTFPGGSFTYSHTLTNNGNVFEGNSTLSTVSLSTDNNTTGFTSNLFYDSNGDGSLDATDPLLSGVPSNLHAVLAVGLAPGQSITIFDKVTAPSGAVPGTVNATTITVTTTNGATPGGYTTTMPTPSVATDSTTVIAGNVTLVKKQSLDTACAGPVVGTVYTPGNLFAKPGECVLYEITVTNVGSADATSVVVSDTTPTFTTMQFVAATSAGTASNPTVTGGTGAITATIGTLTPSQSAVVTFGVKIDQ